MTLNADWGAVAYLSHSSYGLGNVEIELNNNTSFWPGSGTNTIYGQPSADTIKYPQSTTGNITGVFDLNGGSWEYAMGVLDDGTGNGYSGSDTINNSGYNGKLGTTSNYKTDGINFPSKRYYKTYIKDSNNDEIIDWNINTFNLGEALGETRGWYGDYQNFVSIYGPWFLHGGSSSSGTSAGEFAIFGVNGNSIGAHSFRVVVTTE